MKNFTVVGFGIHPHHLYYAQEGSLFPSYDGLVIAYTEVDFLIEFGNFSADSRNKLLIDLADDIQYDLRDTPENEKDKKCL